MNKQQKDVLEFYDKVGGWSRPEKPTMLYVDDAKRCIKLMQEELKEFVDAYNYRDFIAMIDAIVDLLYVTYGTAIAMGIDVEPFWQEVQRSNMTKIGGHKNEMGKLIKPDTYSSADIAGIYSKLYGYEPET